MNYIFNLSHVFAYGYLHGLTGKTSVSNPLHPSMLETYCIGYNAGAKEKRQESIDGKPEIE